jgi:hypothetical protein
MTRGRSANAYDIYVGSREKIPVIAHRVREPSALAHVPRPSEVLICHGDELRTTPRTQVSEGVEATCSTGTYHANP